jgi:hypothetical protein
MSGALVEPTTEDEHLNLESASKLVFLASLILGLGAGGLLWQTALARTELNDFWWDENRWIELNRNVDNLSVLVTVVFVAFVASMATWSFHLHSSLQEISKEGRVWSKGWTIGGWLVPVGHILIPYLVIRESLEIQDRENGPRQTAIGWWIMLWCAVIAGGASSTTIESLEDFDGIYVAKLIQSGALLIMCLLAVFMVKDSLDLTKTDLLDGEEYSDAPTEEVRHRQHKVTPAPEVQGTIGRTSTNLSERLKTLNQLRAEGLLTDNEYQIKRRQLLDQI